MVMVAKPKPAGTVRAAASMHPASPMMMMMTSMCSPSCPWLRPLVHYLNVSIEGPLCSDFESQDRSVEGTNRSRGGGFKTNLNVSLVFLNIVNFQILLL